MCTWSWVSLTCYRASYSSKWKSAQRDANTARWLSKAEPKIFTPSQTPFPGTQDDQNLISWTWSLPLPTNPPWWGLKHAISSYRGNRPAHTHTQTHRQDRLQYTALLSLACNLIVINSFLKLSLQILSISEFNSEKNMKIGRLLLNLLQKSGLFFSET